MIAARTLLRVPLVVALVAPVVACDTGHGAGPRLQAGAGATSSPHSVDVAARPWRDSTWPIAMEVPPGWTVHGGFEASYLANGAWKTYADPDSRGSPVVALVMPGSNRITDAEIRIGVSKAAPEVQRCTTPPDSVRSGSLARTTVGGTRFVTFEAQDAAMSHYLDVRSYRTVHDGVCYAIDLLVYGSDPQVFDPPATPPFSRDDAFARMQAVLASFRFTR